MKRAFVLFVVAMLYCSFSLAQEPDPDPNLLWKTENGYDRFLVHPNGNILAGKYSTEVELDGNTGEIIREFPYQVIFYDISPDGKYISALTDQRCVIDYETEEVIDRFTNSNTTPKFMPDSKTLIYDILEESDNTIRTKLATYNIETGGYRFSPNPLEQTSAWGINVSSNGKFVATGGRFRGSSETDYTRLVLWDAQTLEPIRVLGEFEDFNEVRSIKFSPNSRLVGFQVHASNLYIYNTETFQQYKNYTATGFGFITNDYVALGSGYTQPPVFNLVKHDNDQIIYTKNNSSGISEYNDINNTMIVNYAYLYCYDFQQILTGASIEPEIPNPFIVEYKNNTLLIKNYNITTVQITAQIADINGKMIRQLELNTSTSDFRIPIKLISGTYFLHIKDGGNEYVSKFLVTN